MSKNLNGESNFNMKYVNGMCDRGSTKVADAELGTCRKCKGKQIIQILWCVRLMNR